MQSLLWEGRTSSDFTVLAPGALKSPLVRPSLELIDLVKGLHRAQLIGWVVGGGATWLMVGSGADDGL